MKPREGGLLAGYVFAFVSESGEAFFVGGEGYGLGFVVELEGLASCVGSIGRGSVGGEAVEDEAASWLKGSGDAFFS